MPKFFIYLSSLIGILVIFLGILSSFAFQKNNNFQPQVNVIQEEKKEEINEQEKNKEPEKNEIEEENKILKVLYIIMMVISTLIAVVMIITSISMIRRGASFKKNVFNIIFQILMLLCSFIIKGKMVSVITFIFQIILIVAFRICVLVKSNKIDKTDD